MHTPKKRSVVIVLLLLDIVAVLLFARLMAPIGDGTSARFWRNACGVSLDITADNVRDGVDGGVYPARDDWYVYFSAHMHGESLYRVPRSIAIADYPKVLMLIERSTKKTDCSPLLRRAFVVLEQNRSAIQNDPDRFLSLLRDETMREIKRAHEDVYRYRVSEEKAFNQQWIRVQHFWMNIVFECMFFIGLTLYALTPWMRNRGILGRYCHLGLLPLLLFLPYYLGYAAWTFTSAGPSGGALYPWVIVWFRGFPLWTPVDQWLLGSLPKVLEPLSQPLGPMLSVSGGRPLGPVAALVCGGAIALLISVAVGLLKRGRPA